MRWRHGIHAVVKWGSTLTACAVGLGLLASGRVGFIAGYSTTRHASARAWVTPCVERTVRLEPGVLVFSQCGEPPSASGASCRCWGWWRRRIPEQLWAWAPRWGWNEQAIGAYAPVYDVFVPLWVFLVAAGLPATGLGIVDERRRRRGARGVCHSCGYDRRGLAVGVRCPECGTIAAPASK